MTKTTISLDIPKSAAERAARSVLFDILGQYRVGDINHEQAAKAIEHWRTVNTSLQSKDAVERVALRRIILDILNDAAPAVENLACNQEQMDADGCMVKVSRQAIEEVLAAVNEVAIQVATATSPMAGVEDDDDGQPSEQQEWQDYDRDC